MTNDKTYVAYYRVSTPEQGHSGHGLEAQRRAVEELVHSSGSKIVDEFKEVESGRNPARPKLERAIATARLHGAKLIVAKLDRLARDAAFLLSLRDAGVDFVAADMPEANRLTIGILAMVAEQEAEAISERTKAALAAAKARGTKLGNPDNLTDSDRAKGRNVSAEIRAARADQRALDLKPIISETREEGATSLRDIAAGLNERGIPTARDSDWTATAVKRVLDRLERLDQRT